MRAEPRRSVRRRPRDTSPPLVVLTDVTLRVGERRLFAGTSWSIVRGEHWALVGPNGSGKTALARSLTGEVPLAAGQIWYPAAPGGVGAGWVAEVGFGDQTAMVRRSSSYLQSRYESLEADQAPTVREILPPDTGSDLLDRLGVRGLLDRRVVSLSNGEGRKTLIARALLGRPGVLVLDDPFQGLDTATRRELGVILREVAATGVSLVVVTPRGADVPALVNRVMVVHDGAVVASGTRRLLAAARSPSPAPMTPRTHDAASLPAATRPHGSRGDVLVELRGVNVTYDGVRVLDDVSWTIRDGESWALVGPNGSGKTTLLSLILADNPQAYVNDVRVFGHRRGDGISIWEIKERMGHVSPELQIHTDPEATVLESIRADPAGRVPEASARVWATALDLGDHLDTPLHALSDGRRRLALLARALAKEPLLLVLDEPCQGLDGPHRERLLRTVDTLCRARRVTVLFVTHDLEEIPRSITRVIRLERGAVRSAGRRGRGVRDS